MAIAASIFGIAFAAFCVWLTVRIVNRRERWAKRTAIGLLIGSPIIYLLGAGPAFLVSNQEWCPEFAAVAIGVVYFPVMMIYGDGPLSRIVEWYLSLWMR